ncbi:unnamed protein product [Paramecium sonneborni]|uniref:Uncharacterized protein n=1 Tax=Paramecium sonneborni TaxID=65129 RepID=A0A8S1QYG0_9CILI|nr:unnamed protein product [Paramecium sonneborni]
MIQIAYERHNWKLLVTVIAYALLQGEEDMKPLISQIINTESSLARQTKQRYSQKKQKNRKMKGRC